jgi:extensin-like protein
MHGSAILRHVSVAKSLREKLRQSACARFSTVLGNGADAYHDSHVHLDLIERSNHYRICQWDVLDFAETAALAAKKAAATASNPAVVKVSEIPLPRPAFQSVRPVIEGHTLTCGSLDAASSFGSVAKGRQSGRPYRLSKNTTALSRTSRRCNH